MERSLLWIARRTTTSRRAGNEAELMDALRQVLAERSESLWTVDVFSDDPRPPGARETVRMFHRADIVVGVHGSGQANLIFCRKGTGVVDINLPEPHSQYLAHNSYAIGLEYRLVTLSGTGLHQS